MTSPDPSPIRSLSRVRHKERGTLGVVTYLTCKNGTRAAYVRFDGKEVEEWAALRDLEAVPKPPPVPKPRKPAMVEMPTDAFRRIQARRRAS